MNHRLYNAGILLALLGLASARASSVERSAPASAPAPLLLVEPVWNYGAVYEDQGPLHHKILCINKGTTPLNLRIVRQSCGCVVANIPPDPVPPGNQVAIDVRLDLLGRHGPNNQYIVLADAATNAVESTLNITGIVRRRIDIEPSSVAFTELTPGQIGTEKILLRRGDDGIDFSITRVESADRRLICSILPATPAAPMIQMVQIQLAGQPTDGELKSTVTIFTTHPHVPQKKISVYARFSGPWLIKPASIFFYGSSDNMPAPRVIILESKTGRPFRLELEEPDELKCSIEPPGDTESLTHRLTVKLAQNPGTGTHRWTIKALTTLPDAPQIQIPIVAMIR